MFLLYLQNIIEKIEEKNNFMQKYVAFYKGTGNVSFRVRTFEKS